MSLTFTIKDFDKEGGNPTVEKTGHVQTFRLSDVEADLAKIAKVRTEVTAQLQLEEAKMKNVEHFHEIVTQLSPESIAAIKIYADCLRMKEACEKKLVEIDEAERQYNEEIAEFTAQTGFVPKAPAQGPSAPSEAAETAA
jgi:hypothetical protein